MSASSVTPIPPCNWIASLVTNLAAGISKDALSHDEVIEIANKSKDKLQSFMEKFLIEINLTN